MQLKNATCILNTGQYYDVINFILIKWFHVQYDLTEFLLLPSKSMRVVISRKYLKCTIMLETEKYGKTVE